VVGRRVNTTTERLWELIEELRSQGVDRLPPEAELSERLEVSRATLRDALTQVELSGGITRRPRLGTRITQGPSRWEKNGTPGFPVHLILSLSEFLTSAGIKYSVEELTVRRMHPLPDVARALGMRRDSYVYDVNRVYVVHGTPAAFLQHYVPTTLAGRPVHISSLTEGATTFLTEIEHIEGLYGESRITAEVAGEVLARHLGTEVGAPLLVMYARLCGTELPQPVALGRLVFRPEIIGFIVSANGHFNADRPLSPSQQRTGESARWGRRRTAPKGAAP
jgi:GntR family transcriptional regulator